MPDHRDWHKKYPQICNHVRDVGEVGEVDNGQAFALDASVPEKFQWPTNQPKSDSDTDAPGNYEGGGCKDKVPKDRVDKDAPVKGQDTEFHRDECDVVEVTEDVIALAKHHLIVFRYIDDMSSHAVRRA
jgi:hypothetical protein